MKTRLLPLVMVLISLAMVVGCGDRDLPKAPPALPADQSPVPPSVASFDELPVVPAVARDGSLTSVVGGSCALDAINGAATPGAAASIGSKVMFAGWIADPAKQVPTDARLVFKGEDRAYSVPMTTGGARPDVASALNSEQLQLSGFNTLVELDVEPGLYQLSIVHGSAGHAFECPLNATIEATP